MWELPFIYCGLFVLILVCCCFFCVCCFFFHYVSAKFHLWPSSGDFTFGARGAADRGVESLRCQKIAVSNPTQAGQRFTWSKTWRDRQQLWKAVITGNTRLSIPIRGRGKITWRRPEVKFGRNVVKEETTQKKYNLPRWGQKVRNK